MNIYVSSVYEEKARVSDIQNIMKAQGHTITHDWTKHEKKTVETAPGYALFDIQGIQDADLVIAIMEKPASYRGSFMEIGATLALNKFVFILGKCERTSVLLKHPLITRFYAVEPLVKVCQSLEALAKARK